MQTDEPTEYPVLSPEPLPEEALPPPPDPLADLRSQLRLLHQAGAEQFQQRLKDLGGAETWLASRCPAAHRLLLARVSETTNIIDSLSDLITSETESFWVGLETRLGECGRCPEEGGACDSSNERFAPGVLVQLTLRAPALRPALVETPCERYQDFRMSRRLERAGVGRRLCRVKLQSLDREPRAEVVKAFDEFLDAGLAHDAPKLVQILIEGARAREYGIALLRSTVRAFPNASYRAVHAPTIIRESKDAMTSKRASPMTELASPEVLLVDGVDSAFLQQEVWGVREVQGLYNRRRDLGLATIITALCNAREVFPGASVLRV